MSLRIPALIAVGCLLATPVIAQTAGAEPAAGTTPATTSAGASSAGAGSSPTPAPTQPAAQAQTTPASKAGGGDATGGAAASGSKGGSDAKSTLPEKPLSGKAMALALAFLGAVAMLALLALNRALGASSWSLSDALSEEGTVTLLDDKGAPVIGADGKPVVWIRLVASTSRLIALMGLFVILLLYVGTGGVFLYFLGTGQVVPDGIEKGGAFLLTGLTLFAPYVVNKFASVFQTTATK